MIPLSILFLSRKIFLLRSVVVLQHLFLWISHPFIIDVNTMHNTSSTSCHFPFVRSRHERYTTFILCRVMQSFMSFDRKLNV